MDLLKRNESEEKKYSMTNKLDRVLSVSIGNLINRRERDKKKKEMYSPLSLLSFFLSSFFLVSCSTPPYLDDKHTHNAYIWEDVTFFCGRRGETRQLQDRG